MMGKKYAIAKRWCANLVRGGECLFNASGCTVKEGKPCAVKYRASTYFEVCVEPQEARRMLRLAQAARGAKKGSSGS